MDEETGERIPLGDFVRGSVLVAMDHFTHKLAEILNDLGSVEIVSDDEINFESFVDEIVQYVEENNGDIE